MSERKIDVLWDDNPVDVTAEANFIWSIANKLDAYFVFSLDDAEKANDFFYDKDLTDSKKAEKITYLLSKAKKEFNKLDEVDQEECYLTMRKFVRFYEFLLQVSLFNDTDLHKKYNFIVWLLPYLKVEKTGVGFDLKGKIQASNFYQKKGAEVKVGPIISDPVVKLPTAETFNLTENEEKRLSDIIKEVNSRTGKSFDSDVALKAALQIRDLLKKNPNLIASAKTNTINDFEFSFFSEIDDALVDGLHQNQDFFTMLLNNEDIKKEVLGIFLKSIYQDLKEDKEEVLDDNLKTTRKPIIKKSRKKKKK